MAFAPIPGKPVRFPPGRVEIRLTLEHRSAYRALYARYESILSGLPILREGDFDGRAVRITAAQLEALNCALAKLAEPHGERPASVFTSQEAARSRLFKRLQYLS